MKELLKKYPKTITIAFILLFLLPIVIDLITVCPAFYPKLVAGEQSDWINFFAVFSGSLISAFVSFYILYKTIEANKIESALNRQDNHTENEGNRKSLEAFFKYQAEKDTFQTAKEYVARFDLAVDCFELGFVPMYCRLNKEDTLFHLKQFMKDLSNAHSLLEFYLNDYNNDVEREYKEYFKEFCHEENVLIGDILWIIDYWIHQGNDDQNRDLFIEKTEIFKHAAPDTRFKRIWHYVEEHDYKMIADGEIIINERLNDFDFITIHQKLLDFCNYEKEKINSILKV